jgi:hypothetical protein
MSPTLVGTAVFAQYSNDIYWSIYTKAAGKITWTGYNDAYWWWHVATKRDFLEKHGKDNRIYILDPETNIVTSRLNTGD